MTIKPPDAATHARQALGIRLRDIRKSAGLSGRALAVHVGCHFTKISRIEHGGQTPSEDLITAWCRACHAEDQLADLIASVRAIESMYLEWRRQTRAGMKRLMLSSVPLYERTRLFRIYEHNVIPGLLQTAEYSAVVLRYFIDFLDTPNDLEAAVAARMERQRVLYKGDRRFLIVIEEHALRAQVGSPETMIGQLDRVLAVMSLPRVSLGIIPAHSPRAVFASVGFWIYDNTMVGVETPSASLEITQPREIRLYETMHAQLHQQAVHGTAARALIAKAIDDLGHSNSQDKRDVG